MIHWLTLAGLVSCVAFSHAEENLSVDTALSSTTLSGSVGVTVVWYYDLIDLNPVIPAYHHLVHPMTSPYRFSGAGLGYVADGGVNTPPNTSWPSGGVIIPSGGGGVGVPGLPGYHHGPNPMPPPPVPEGPGSSVSIDFSAPGAATVPEPSTVGMLLMGMSVATVLAVRSRKSSQR